MAMINKGRPFTVAAFFKCLFLEDNKVLSLIELLLLVLIHVAAIAGFHVVAWVLAVIAVISFAIMVSNFFVAKNHYTWGEISKPVTNGTVVQANIVQK
jgi:K+-sensing histidine kinase KdpD